jgi:hypothetical protein
MTQPGKVAVMDDLLLSAFVDESTDATQSRVFAVAGVIGQAHVWQAAERLWVERTSGAVFHATDCEHGGDLVLYKDLTQLLAQSGLSGYGVALNLLAFKEHFPVMLQDLGYYACLLKVVPFLAERAQQLERPIEFTFHRRDASKHNTVELYRTFLQTPEWSASQFMKDEVRFDSLDNPRVQMADLFARETMKSLDNQLGTPQREPRKSMLALCGTRFKIDLLSQEFCAGWSQATDRSGVAHEYAAWLSAYKLDDNFTNRIRFMSIGTSPTLTDKTVD